MEYSTEEAVAVYRRLSDPMSTGDQNVPLREPNERATRLLEPRYRTAEQDEQVPNNRAR